MTAQPLNSAPPQGPVEGRGVAEIRADLACCDRDGVPWPAAARRLVADVPSLLAEVEAAHRFEQAWTAESAGLVNTLNGVAAERDSLRGVVQAAREFIAVSDTTAPMDSSGTDVVMTREDFNRLTLAEDALAAALAAAADAPQPLTLLDEIGGDECGDLLPGDENLPLAANVDPVTEADREARIDRAERQR